MSEKHEVPDHTLNSHELMFRDLFSGLNKLRDKSGTYLTLKAGATFFLGTIVALVVAFLGQSHIQSQTFLEIRRQDQAEATAYRVKTDQAILAMDRDVVRLKIVNKINGDG